MPTTMNGLTVLFVALYLPLAFVRHRLRNDLSQISNGQTISIPDQTWQFDNLDWHVDGLTLKARAALSNGKLTPASYTIATGRLWVKAHIKNMSVDQIIQTVVHGVNLNIHLKADCGPITLTERHAQARLKVDYRLSPAPLEVKISSFLLSWPRSSWEIAPITCRGPKGFSTTFTNTLRMQLNNPQPIRNLIADKIETELKSKLDAIDTPFTQIRPLKSGFLMTKGTSNLPIKSRDLAHFKVPMLITYKYELSNLIRAEIRSLPDRTLIDLNKIPTFEKLAHSHFEKMFIWPDLKNFETESPFTLTMKRPKLEAIRWQNNGVFQAAVAANGWITAYRDGRFWHYLDLESNALLNCWPQIQNGRLTLFVVIDDVQFEHQIGAVYLKYFKSASLFSDKELARIFVKRIRPYQFSRQLPKVHLGVLGSAYLNGWRPLRRGVVAIPLKISERFSRRVRKWSFDRRQFNFSVFSGAYRAGSQ